MAIIQVVTGNGSASSGVIGLNSGASFALALTYAVLPNTSFLILMFAGFLGAILGGAIVLMIGRSRRDGFIRCDYFSGCSSSDLRQQR